jgi:Kef-type K+ transport system membrane component KefB
MNPITISVVVFACVFGGGLVGMFIHSHLPTEHLDSNSKEAVRLGMALVGTTVALVLGLLIASGKGFYDTQNSEVTQLAADVVMLDKILKHYGPETKELRDFLRSSVARIVDDTWERASSDKTHFAPSAASETLFDRIQELSPHNDSQRFLQSQALSTVIKLGQTRTLMVAQKTSSVPMPLLTVLVFWLTLLFMSFGLFVRPNVVVVVSLFASALAVCAAILLILEMYQPYAGLIQVSSAPLRAALAQLGQ